MKKICYSLLAGLSLLISCDDGTENKFDKSSDERAAIAIAQLRDELTAPANGWRLKYQPEDGSGSFWVLLDFNDDNSVIIQSDLGARDGEFFMDTLTYRVDNSLGLELIFETYSFFSYLFERDQATFLAEYEYLYVNKTPDGSLVFQSKSDPGTATVVVFEEASANDADLLGQEVSTNINTIAGDISGLMFSSPAYQLTYQDRDLRFFLSMDESRRTISINAALKKSTSTGAQSVAFTTGYYLQGDSLVFQERLTGIYQGINISLKGILFSKLTNGSMDICGGIPIHLYEGVTSQNDDVVLEGTLISPEGAGFANFEFLVAPLEYIFNNGESMAAQIQADIVGAGSMQLYYNYSGGFYGLGFFIENADGTTTFFLREFTPQRTGNKIVFNFEPTISVFGNPDTPADINKVNAYLNALTQDGQTYVFLIQDDIFELHNPCTGWSAVFFGVQ
jgi:hypothetical protein